MIAHALEIVPAPNRPDPATLDADAIDALFVTLRDERERLMRDLRACELRAGGATTPAALLDAMELRLELNALLGYWRQLLARLLSLHSWPQLGSGPPCFAEIDGDEHWRSARARVPLTPDSLLFVHGPVTLWHAAALAEQMLGEGDRLTRLVRGAFHRELTVEPRILLWDMASDAARPAFDAADVAVEGAFATASGRELAFVALAADGAVPTRRAGWHPITAHVIAALPDKQAQPTAIRQRFAAPALRDIRAERGSDVLLAKAEAVIAGFTQHILVGERVLLLSRALNVTIDADLGAWLARSPEIHFELDWARQRAIPGRGGFVPMRYRVVPDDANWQRSLFVCLDSHLDF